MFVTLTLHRLLGARPLRYGVRVGIMGVMLAMMLATGFYVIPQVNAIQATVNGPVARSAGYRSAPRRVQSPARSLEHPVLDHRDRRPGAVLVGSQGIARSRISDLRLQIDVPDLMLQIDGTDERITLIPGDGIGPEVTRAVVRVLEAAGFTPEWESFSAGADAVEEHGTTLPQPLLDSIARNKIALKGPITTPVGKGFTSVNVGLRKALDLYANLRPVWNLPSVPSRYTGVDLVIVRENTEDLYAGLEHTVVPGVVESLKIITDKASTRIAEFAFEQARRRGRKKVTRRAQGQHHEAQ